MNKLIVFVLIMLAAGCVEQQDIDFFSKNGVGIGVPVAISKQVYRLPVSFKTKIMHSAKWIYDVKHKVTDSEIHITALYSIPPNAQKGIYKGWVKIKVSSKKSYKVFYINKNKSKYYLRDIQFK